MAKLKAPLMSLGASGQLAKTLVFFPWKGLNVAREYVVPANPDTQLQKDQRGYVRAAVDAIHAAIALAADGFQEVDRSAYALWANQERTPRTWFNQAVKNIVDVFVAEKSPVLFYNGETTPGEGELDISVDYEDLGEGALTAATVFYGKSPSALFQSATGAVADGAVTATLENLTPKKKYYWQVRADAADPAEGARSGVYFGVPLPVTPP